jgi:hypothetical protein
VLFHETRVSVVYMCLCELSHNETSIYYYRGWPKIFLKNTGLIHFLFIRENTEPHVGPKITQS